MWDPGNPSKMNVCFTASALPTRSVTGDVSLFFKGALPDKYCMKLHFTYMNGPFKSPRRLCLTV